MLEIITIIMNKERKKNRFISVDVWRSSFGDISVKAIFELYRTHSGCTSEQFKKTKMRDMVDYLRKLDNPDYVPVTLPINHG